MIITDMFLRDITACIARIRAAGEHPNTILMHPEVACMRRVCGNRKQRRSALRHNNQRIRFFRETFGLEVRYVRF